MRSIYSAHPAQAMIHRCRHYRFRTVCTGRRFGKTLCLAAELIDRQNEPGAHGDYGWVAPTYNVAERGIEAFRMVGDKCINVVGRTPSRIEYKGCTGPIRVWFLSADNPDSIRGFGFKGLVIDEAAAIPQSVWHYVLRPTISQTLGWAVFVSTPKGRNWFYDMFTRGADGAEQDYVSFSFPSKVSPYFPAKEWEEAKRTLPEDVFRQEYMAEFLEDSAGVFRGIDACLLNAECGVRNAEYHRSVVIGCDVAKHTDWTVLVAMDASNGRCFDMERFNQLDWPIQKERITAFARKYRGRVILDGTGIGDPIYDDLKRVLPDIEAYKLTATSKVELIQNLMVAVEQRLVCWPAARVQGSGFGVQGEASTTKSANDAKGCGDWEILTNEMKRFEYQISPSGGISYGAPAGYHDDCVMALALANRGRKASQCAGTMRAFAPRSNQARYGWRRGRVMVGG